MTSVRLASHAIPWYDRVMASHRHAAYDTDVIAWANEQARLLRAGNFAALDIEHLADEVEDVGKSEQRELESRMALLLCHMLKWQFQPGRRGASWQKTINAQREGVGLRIKRTPSLKASLADPDWLRLVWIDALDQAEKETGLDGFPETCPWSVSKMLDPTFMPD